MCSLCSLCSCFSTGGGTSDNFSLLSFPRQTGSVSRRHDLSSFAVVGAANSRGFVSLRCSLTLFVSGVDLSASRTFTLFFSANFDTSSLDLGSFFIPRFKLFFFSFGGATIFFVALFSFGLITFSFSSLYHGISLMLTSPSSRVSSFVFFSAFSTFISFFGSSILTSTIKG